MKKIIIYRQFLMKKLNLMRKKYDIDVYDIFKVVFKELIIISGIGSLQKLYMDNMFPKVNKDEEEKLKEKFWLNRRKFENLNEEEKAVVTEARTQGVNATFKQELADQTLEDAKLVEMNKLGKLLKVASNDEEKSNIDRQKENPTAQLEGWGNFMKTILNSPTEAILNENK